MTAEDVQKLIADGYATMEEIKKISRCGMGPCQGKTCRTLLAGELARATGRGAGEIKMPAFRPPTAPVKLGAFLVGEEAAGAGNEGDSGGKFCEGA